MVRSQVRRGQMPTLKNSSFCCLLTKERSTLSSRDCSLQSRASLALATLEWMEMGVPRKRNVDAPVKGMGRPERGSLGSYALPVKDLMAMVMHLGTLAFMPDHSSHESVASNRVRQDDGLSAIREVSSVYWSRLVLCRGTDQGEPQVRVVLDDGVHQCAHHGVKDDQRDRVTLVDTLEHLTLSLFLTCHHYY